MGGKPERNFLSCYLLSACCTHQHIHPHFYKKRAKGEAKEGLQGDSTGPAALLGGQGEPAGSQAPARKDASHKPSSPHTSPTDTQKGRQLPKEAGIPPQPFPKGTHLGCPWEGLALHGAGLSSRARVMARGQWQIRIWFNDICDPPELPGCV